MPTFPFPSPTALSLTFSRGGSGCRLRRRIVDNGAGRDGRKIALDYPLHHMVEGFAACSVYVLVVAKEGALRAWGKDSLLQSDTLKSGRERGDYMGALDKGR